MKVGGNLGKLYDYLLSKYKNVISDNLSEYIVLIDGRKKDYDEYVHMDLKFLKSTKEYIAILKIEEIIGKSSLDFALSDEKYSRLFFKYIIDFLISEDECFYRKINDIVLTDYHKELLNIKEITISNAVIDHPMLMVLSRFFKELDILHFSRCTIQKDCDFCNLKGDLNFYDCEISSTNVFKYCKQDVRLEGCRINHITNSVINSRKINIDKLDDATLANFFLFCHFPELKDLTIGNPTSLIINENNHYNQCLKWLPHACPRLVNLLIEGKVSSFDFLYHFHKLSKVEIRSMDDSIGIYKIYNPYLTNIKEREEIIKRSNRKMETDMDINLAIFDKLSCIIQMLNIVGFTEEEKNIYLHQKLPLLLNPISYLNERKIDSFYSFNSKNKKLELQNNDREENIIVDDKFYTIEKTLEGRYIKRKQQVITSKPFLYHPSGIPIVFHREEYSYQEYIDQAIKMQDMFILEEKFDNQKIKFPS